MNIVIDPALQAYIDPLTAEELEALERSLLTEGCRDALVLWGEVLVDGHNRYGICQKHGLPFQTVQNPRFQSLEDVQLWMIEQHLGRRSVSNFQRGVLALRKREILAARQRAAAGLAQATPSATTTTPAEAGAPAPSSTPAPLPRGSREAIAKEARLSSSQVQMIERIQQQAAPEVVAAVRAGSLSINAAAAVASLPAEEQVAAAQAGEDQLKAAAKRAREAKRKPRDTPPATATPSPSAAAQPADAGGEPASPPWATGDAAAPDAETTQLRQRLATLEAENQALRAEVARLQALLN